MKKEKTEAEFSEILNLKNNKLSSELQAEDSAADSGAMGYFGRNTNKNNIGEESFTRESREEFLPKGDFAPAKWARIGRALLYALVFLVPLFFLSVTSSPVEINKNFLAAVLVILAFICYLADVFTTKRVIYPKSLLFLSAFTVLFFTAVSAVFSVDRILSFYGNLFYPDSLASFILYFLIFFLAAVFFRKGDIGKIGIAFLSGFILASLLSLAALLGFSIFPFEFAKQTGFNTVGSVSDLGIFIAFGLVLSIAALSELRLSLSAKIILLFASLIAFIELFLLNLQIIWIGVAFAMIILAAHKFVFSLEHRHASFAGFSAMPMAVIILSLFFVLIGPSMPSLVEVPVQIKPGFELTAGIVKETAKNGDFFVGSGPATFARDYAFYRPLETNQANFWLLGFGQGYSFLSTILSTLGILGFLAFLFLFYAFTRKLIKNSDNKELIVVSFGVIILMAMLFVQQASLVQFVFIFLGLGLMVSLSDSSKIIFLANVSKACAFLSFIAIIAATAASLALVYLVGQKYIAAIYYERGVAAYGKSKDAEKSLNDIYKAMKFDMSSGQYLRALSQYLLLDAEAQSVKMKNLPKSSSEEAVNINAQIQNDIAQAIDYAQKASVVNPGDSANWSNLANVYERIISVTDGADQFAAENYRKAMELDPKNPELPFSLARVLLNSALMDKEKDPKNETVYRNKIAEAKNSLDKAISLKPDYAVAYYQKALAYVQEEKIREAADEMEKTKILAPDDSSVAFQLGLIYYNDSQLDKAQKELERAVLLSSEYSNARYILGLVYSKQGKKDKAILQMEKVLKLNPKNEEVMKILSDLKNSISVQDNNGDSLPEKNPVLPVEKDKDIKP